jgi:hypothetical protein
MDNTIDIDALHAEINRLLPWEQQIQKGDPVYEGIVANKVALGAHVYLIQKNLDSVRQQLTATSDQLVERAEVIAERLIFKAGNSIEKQLNAAALCWEERLRDAAKTTEAKMEATVRRASWLTWTGAILIFISSCVGVGSYMGTVAFDLMHHTKQRHW